MIFKTYRELINYVLKYYPYEKIITYCRDLRYKFLITNGREIIRADYPEKNDIKKFLVCAMSDYFRKRIVYPNNPITSEEKRIVDICVNFPYNINDYFTVSILDNRKLVISFKYRYLGWKYRKYSQIYTNPRYGNPRTKVVMRFREDIL